MAVRSNRFALSASAASGAFVVLVAVPVGRTAIVREATLQNRTSATTQAQFLVRNGSTVVCVARTAALAHLDVFRLSGYFPLDPGDELVGDVGTGSGTFSAYCGGSLLMGEPV